MLILSRKQNQEIVFPKLGVRIEVARIRGNTVCLGIDAPKEIAILRGELKDYQVKPEADPRTPGTPNHELRNRLNAMSLCLHVIKEKHESQTPIESRLLTRAIQELHTIEEICGCERTPNPFVARLHAGAPSPFVLLVDDATNEAELLAAYLRHVGIQVATSSDGDSALNLLDCFDCKPGLFCWTCSCPVAAVPRYLELYVKTRSTTTSRSSPSPDCPRNPSIALTATQSIVGSKSPSSLINLPNKSSLISLSPRELPCTCENGG